MLAAFPDSSNMSFPTPSLSYTESALNWDFSQLFHFGYKTLLYLKPKVKGVTADVGNFRMNVDWFERLILGDDLHEFCFQGNLVLFCLMFFHECASSLKSVKDYPGPGAIHSPFVVGISRTKRYPVPKWSDFIYCRGRVGRREGESENATMSGEG